MSHYKPDPNKKVNLTINGQTVTVPEGTRILQAAIEAGVKIPTLCDYPDLCRRAVCRICVVECDGRSKLVAACANDVWEGVNIVTNNYHILSTRKTILELLLAGHPQDCLNCVRNKKCELQNLAADFGIRTSPFHNEVQAYRPAEVSGETLVRDMSKCVKCGRCVEVCQETQTVRAINTAHRSVNYEICTPFDKALGDGPCIFCGRCAAVCPVGAIYGYDQTAEVWEAVYDNERHVAAQLAPSMETAICGEFGLPPGTVTRGKLVSALRRMGFNKVYDGSFFQDLSIHDFSYELIDRIENNGKLPMIYGCSHAWINFVKNFYPDLLKNLFTNASPRHLFRTWVKTHYSGISGADKSKITSISIVPCIAGKNEPRLPADTDDSGNSNFVLATAELARMIRLTNIDLATLPESPFDSFTGDSQDSMSAAALVRAAEPDDGQGIKEAAIDIRGTKLKALIVSGLVNARKVMDSIRKGECDAALVEIISCPDCCTSTYTLSNGASRP